MTFVDAINVKNNVNSKKIAFYADGNALIKLLRQKKGMVLKGLSRNFPASRGRCQD